MERFARRHGLRKGQVIEAALLHHLQAFQELPADVIVPPRLVVTAASGQRLLERLTQADEPTAAMREMSVMLGGIGLVVDAKPEAVAFYQRYGFEPLDVLEGSLSDCPEPTAMFLPLSSIPNEPTDGEKCQWPPELTQ